MKTEIIAADFSKTTKPSAVCPFEIQFLGSVEQVQSIRPVWESLQAKSTEIINIEVDFDRYISAVKSDRKREPYILLLLKTGIPHAMLIGTREQISIPCKLGYWNVMSPSLHAAKVVYGGFLGHYDEQTCDQMIEYLYQSTRSGIVDVVRFEQIPRKSLLFSRVRSHPSFFCRGYFPKFDKHWQLDVPDRMESFYSQHSSKTRQTLKRYTRKLEKNHEVYIRECRDAETLTDILPMAAAISQKTYQHALGWGLVNDEATYNRLQMAAQQGWLRFHVLCLNERPCAFQYGYQYQGTYYLQTMGFDPELRNLHAGTVLFLKIIEQLCNDPEVDLLDFGYGDAEYKRRFGTTQWDEATLYMFAPRIYPVLVNSVHTVFKGLSCLMQWSVQKAGVEGAIKQQWRRLLQKSN